MTVTQEEDVKVIPETAKFSSNSALQLLVYKLRCCLPLYLLTKLVLQTQHNGQTQQDISIHKSNHQSIQRSINQLPNHHFGKEDHNQTNYGLIRVIKMSLSSVPFIAQYCRKMDFAALQFSCTLEHNSCMTSLKDFRILLQIISRTFKRLYLSILVPRVNLLLCFDYGMQVLVLQFESLLENIRKLNCFLQTYQLFT